MTTRLLLDEMLSPEIGKQLSAESFDVVAVAAVAGLRGRPDEHVISVAAQEHRILVTLNIRDYARLHESYLRRGEVHAGLVYVSPARFPMGRGFIGSVVRALIDAEKLGGLPPPGDARFL